jgi:DNA-directed RNA polymerase alpha subunit
VSEESILNDFTPTAELEISNQALGVLKRGGILNVGAFLRASDGELRRIKACGSKTFAELVAMRSKIMIDRASRAPLWVWAA